MVRELRFEGTMTLLTTQYLEDADQLAQLVAVIDKGLIVAEGTSAQLKETVGRDRLVVRIADRSGPRTRVVRYRRSASDGPPVVLTGRRVEAGSEQSEKLAA
jgi:ABC-type multidrug transport system ATPase subunit